MDVIDTIGELQGFGLICYFKKKIKCFIILFIIIKFKI